MAFGMKNPFEEYGKRVANTISTGMKESMAPKPQNPLPQPPQAQPTAPQGLQPVEPLSQAGQIYKQRVTQNLLNPNPLAQSAQAQADTNMSRRNYLTQKQTQETMAQSPFGAGTRQYQRALMEGQAGANTANLGEQNQVNAYTRGLSEKSMEDARGLEDTEFARALGERGYQDQNASRYSALIQDTKGRQAYNRLVASGVNPSVALQQILEEGGTIKEGYRGQSNMEQLKSEASDWIESTTDLKRGMPGFEEAVRKRMVAIDSAQNKPLTDATKQRKIEDIEAKQRRGEPLTAEETTLLMGEGKIDQLTVQTVPRHPDAVNEWLKNNPSRQMNIDGNVYTVQKGESIITGWKDQTWGDDTPTHTDVLVVTDETGKTKYVYNNQVSDAPPKSKG
jgi:hypothetical protein